MDSDYFYINSSGGPFTVRVTNFLPNRAQVNLYYKNASDHVAIVGDQSNGTYVIHYDGARGPGKYLIRVVAMSVHPKGNGDYTLRVTTPQTGTGNTTPNCRAIGGSGTGDLGLGIREVVTRPE
jgi:hypothetical protein